MFYRLLLLNSFFRFCVVYMLKVWVEKRNRMWLDFMVDFGFCVDLFDSFYFGNVI